MHKCNILDDIFQQVLVLGPYFIKNNRERDPSSLISDINKTEIDRNCVKQESCLTMKLLGRLASRWLHLVVHPFENNEIRGASLQTQVARHLSKL